jgi:hypothetical protein
MIPGTMPEVADEVRVPVIPVTGRRCTNAAAGHDEKNHAAPGTALSLVRQPSRTTGTQDRRRRRDLPIPFEMTAQGMAALAHDETRRPENHPHLVASRQSALMIRDRCKQASDDLPGAAAAGT